MRPEVLSKRLRTAADMVTVGSCVCDVGCDHGYVSIYLVQKGISPRVLAMDVRKGPLTAAREHVAQQKLEDRIETRLSDGLHNYKSGEAQTLLCAGMGGRLMRRILEEDREKTASFRELILQPQSELEGFRRFLRENGYRTCDEEMLEEDGKFYQVIRAVPPGAGDGKEAARRAWIRGACDLPENELCKLEDRYGAVILNKRTDVFLSYLAREERLYGEILDELRAHGLSDQKRKDRYGEIQARLEDCKKVRALLG